MDNFDLKKFVSEKTLSYDEALNMVAEFVKFTGMDSTGEDFLNHIADTEESFKR